MSDWFHHLDASSKVMIVGMTLLLLFCVVTVIISVIFGGGLEPGWDSSIRRPSLDAGRTLPIVVDGGVAHD